MKKLIAFHRMFAHAAMWLQSPLLLAVRLYWGYGFFIAGLGKLKNLDRTAGFFEKIGIPAPKLNACMAGSVECFGGALLAVGLLSRLVSLPLAFTMVVAYYTAELDVVKNIFNKPEDFTSAAPFLFLLASLIVLAFGPGSLSLDRVIEKFFIGKGSAPGSEKKRG